MVIYIEIIYNMSDHRKVVTHIIHGKKGNVFEEETERTCFKI